MIALTTRASAGRVVVGGESVLVVEVDTVSVVTVVVTVIVGVALVVVETDTTVVVVTDGAVHTSRPDFRQRLSICRLQDFQRRPVGNAHSEIVMLHRRRHSARRPASAMRGDHGLRATTSIESKT